MSLIYSNHFLRRLKRRTKKNQQLKQKVGRQLNLLLNDENHPALRRHRLKGERASQQAIDIESNLRITFIKRDNNIILTDIITHDEY